MAVGEFVSVSQQADMEKADVAAYGFSVLLGHMQALRWRRQPYLRECAPLHTPSTTWHGVASTAHCPRIEKVVGRVRFPASVLCGGACS